MMSRSRGIDVRQIPFFDYSAHYGRDGASYLEEIRRVLERGAYILQQELEDFERKLAVFLDAEYAIGVANGTDALHLALLANDIGDGHEVICPSHTFVATAAAIHHSGAQPVLVDVRDDHLIDPEAIRDAVTPRTRAILPVHLNGRVSDMEPIMEIARDYDLIVVEDSAQAIGATYRGRFGGTFGRAAGFSFYPAKILGCFGDGGGVVTNDPAVADRVRWLRDHGRHTGAAVAEWSLNSRLDNVQAAILSMKLEALSEDLDRRRAIAGKYQAALQGVGDLLLPPSPEEPGRRDVFQNYEIETSSRDELMAHLSGCGVRTIIQWGGVAVHQMSALGFGDVSLPVTERIMERSLLLPMNPFLSDDDVHYVCEQVRGFF